MLKGRSLFILPSIVLFMASAAAQDGIPEFDNGPPTDLPGPVCVERSQLVGLSADTIKGSQGIINLNNLCNSTYPGSHMCSTEEILHSLQTLPDDESGWVRPTVIGAVSNDSTVFIVDVTGRPYDADEATCDAWSINGSEGLVLSGPIKSDPLLANLQGVFRIRSCLTERPVSCCAFARVCTGFSGTPGIEVISNPPDDK